jgi:hypothetical protein
LSFGPMKAEWRPDSLRISRLNVRKAEHSSYEP